jgi:ABC-2 type transport system permease protein
MNKISLIIKREYLSRVKKKSFIIMTLLGPILMAAIIIVPVIVGMNSHTKHTIMVLDETGWFVGKFKSNKDGNGLTFKAFTGTPSEGKDSVKSGNFYALLYIAKPIDIKSPQPIIYAEKQPDINVKDYVSSIMEKEVEKVKLAEQGITPEQLSALKADITVTTININEKGKEEKSSTELAMVLGYISSLIIYMFIFIYGVQVMRGVLEEKTSRIVEVIISSVKPFQLMMGKILGIAMVCLTQVLLWIVLTTTIITVFKTVMPDKFNFNQTEQVKSMNNASGSSTAAAQVKTTSSDKQVGNDMLISLGNVNYVLELSMFVLFFIGGYLLYSSLFAAIGAAVDNETDLQQFMLPITVPLIISIVAAQAVMRNPDGPLAFWLSIIPFTSPIIMMVRLPFNVPVEQIILSLSLLVVGFLGTTWIASKVYRIGILMYGKKIDYKELWKWIMYKG